MKSEPIRTSPLDLDTGFRAELDAMDLPSLIQLACLRRERRVLRVRGHDDEGFLYFDGGSLVHAHTSRRAGEEAVFDMLHWAVGEVASCARAFPARATIHGSTEGLLLRAAQQRDEQREATMREESSNVHKKPTIEDGRRLEVVPTDLSVAPRSRTGHADAPLLASVRVDPNGEVLAAQGNAELLSQLVAYVTRMGAILGAELALDPFQALYAELAGERLLVFADGADMVGLLLKPGTTVDELRHQLGV